ncbi:listerin E3 ubiquitin protein ligase 1 [Boothiomyces macroporosus]|uniref:E3 ubiquitin-protein ligase listerin n=1 Tax=Boothiomyces macroporosus TaxID=261099 RepID=A0AAD5UIF5_9FUNG|nr:listerin E3 ubiquitin protein ligase 1 [Boothiomyces macroporosus]
MLTAVDKTPLTSGKLELIIGCMFSGKSTELISRIRKHKIIESNYIVINHSKDTRYDENQIVSHNLDKEACFSTTHLLPFLETKAYKDHHVFFIEEAQFFPDLLDFVAHAVDSDFKHVIVCGLDGDYQRRPIGQVLQLIPIADTVDKLRALCAICKDGTEALFSLRRTSDTSVELIGGLDEYLPVFLRERSLTLNTLHDCEFKVPWLAGESLCLQFLNLANLKRMSKKPRVKGNPTAANSARAQQFLGQNYSFGLGSVEDYSNLEPELRVILRKLSKKDSTTKTKALEELLSYFNQNAVESDALTAWANIFPKIAIDIDRKVREMCFAVHLKLVNLSKKQFGLIIKQIIGTWIICRFDSSKEVAKLASESFQEVQEYLSSNLLHQTADTLSDARFATKDEMEAKYHRVVSGSIDGLGFVIQNLPVSKRSNEFETLLSSKTFWTFSYHISSHIRGAMYRLISTLTRNGQAHKEMIACQFLARVFNDKESIAYSFMWEAILLVSKSYPEMWIIASEKKPILPKVLQFLKSGAHGSGKLSYTCLLPLIGHIPADLINESPDFYTDFFSSFWIGHSLIDRNASEAFVDAYYECLYYVLRKGSSDKRKVLLTQYLYLPLENLMHGKSEYSQYLNNSLINIIVFLLKSTEEEEGVEKLLHLLSIIIPIGKITDDNIDVLLKFSLESDFMDYDRLIEPGIRAVLETLLKAGEDKIKAIQQLKNAKLPNLRSEILETQLLTILDSTDSINEDCVNFVVNLTWSGACFISDRVLETFYMKLGNMITTGRAKLMKFDTEQIVLDPNVTLKLVFGIQVVKGLSSQPNTKLLELVFELAELANCKPLSVAKIVWTPSLPPGASEFAIFEKLYDEANNAVNALALVQHEKIQPFIIKLLKRWHKESFSKGYSASASDCVAILTTILGFTKDLSAEMVQSLSGTKDEWISHFNQFINFYDDSVELHNGIHSWRTAGEKKEPIIYYDFDGISSYAKRGIIYCTLLKKDPIGKHIRQPWILLELERLKQICIYTQYTPHSLFDADSPIQSDHLIQEIDELLLNCLIESEENTIELLQNILEKNTKDSGNNVLLESYIYAAVESDNISVSEKKISDCEIFACLLAKYLELCPQPAIVLVRLLNSLIESGDRVITSAGITSIVPYIKSHLELSAIFKKLLKPVLAIKKSDLSKVESRIGVTLLFHFLFPDGNPLEESFFNEQDQKSFIRWVRTLYDADISEAVNARHAQSSERTLNDAHITAILAFFIAEITREAFDLGVNMNRFVVDLAVHFFRGFKLSEITPALGCHLYHSIALWDSLKTAFEEDEDPWVKVGDVQSEIEQILLQLFIDTGHSDKSNILGFSVLQTKLSRVISQLDFNDHYDELQTQEELVQINAYKILQMMVAKEVERKTLEIEMNKVDENEILTLNQYLTSNLLRNGEPSMTFELRQLYIEHIRNLDIFNKFLEIIFDLLNVGTLLPTFDLSNWDIEEFLIEYFEKNSPTAIPLLCSHLYLRALKSVPTLARIWFTECKNRQLILGVESFTEKYFSKILIANECASIQTHADDDFSVKFNPNSHEINAAYKFEEAELDIVIKLPSCYPLKQIDISAGTAGGRQAGISEARWRGWLLSITSVITGQNGTVSDAIYLFKKNVKLHFEGIEDCAICYSVISAIDRSTPQKKCRVCKHIFHGSCLFKWFKSSNQNTCPLCRQPF